MTSYGYPIGAPILSNLRLEHRAPHLREELTTRVLLFPYNYFVSLGNVRYFKGENMSLETCV
jgi:hypothetical protein